MSHNNMKKILIFLALMTSILSADARERQLFDNGWLFRLADSTQMAQKDYNDRAWRRLNLPQDWAIEGDFRVTNPSGAKGGALPGGIGWYRKHCKINPTAKNDKYYIDFDGVYMNSTVYVNGHCLGTRPYGYSSFQYDLTPYLNKEGDNVIAVRVDNGDQPNSRWYSGCGIYRHVWLTSTSDTHIAHWGVHVVTSVKGEVNVSVQLEGANGSRPVVRNTVYDDKGKVVARKESRSLTQQLKVKSPKLWSVDSPNIYSVKSEVMIDGKAVDSETTTTGFRSFRFDDKTGFWLNGKNIKVNGVCLHHDQGCLGSALHEDAVHRQLKMMKEMGVNAIRTTHNPPAPELLNMCDTMGLLVMDESFDMWRQKKTEHDYARYFDKWFERDLSDMLLRDRNHPSVFMWSIGNEIREQRSKESSDSLLVLKLAEIVRKYDNTRPITAGCNYQSRDNMLFKAGALDVIGYNYHQRYIKDVPTIFPGKPFIMTESVSAVETRGYYRMPSDKIFIDPSTRTNSYTNPTFMCSGYDNEKASWGATHEENWDIVKHTPFCSGQFIWTGFDYIGEPTPYDFPARSSYFGIVDLAGFPKDVYYMYQSEWTTKPVLHLFPHWNWLPGQTVDMWCYYNNADEAELFVNGKSQGIRRKGDHDYHVMWRVKYEPGEVKVVARRDGNIAGEQTLRTAGQPSAVKLSINYDGLRENGGLSEDIPHLVYVEADIVDSNGNICSLSDNEVFFSAEGAEIIGVDNGLQTSMERFKADHRKAFNGKCIVIIQPTAKNFTIKAQAVGLKESVVKR